ncbi:hypothetical protein [Saccharopolyspora sp. NPDC002376]
MAVSAARLRVLEGVEFPEGLTKIAVGDLLVVAVEPVEDRLVE